MAILIHQFSLNLQTTGRICFSVKLSRRHTKRQVAPYVLHCTCKTSHCDMTPVQCTHSDLVWGGMKTSFLTLIRGAHSDLVQGGMWTSSLTQHGRPNMILFYWFIFLLSPHLVAESIHTVRPTLLLLILSLRSVARIQTGLNLYNWSQRQWFSQN